MDAEQEQGSTALAPADCQDLTQTRRGIDEADVWLVALLARRLAYAKRGSAIKMHRSEVFNEGRVAQVIDNVIAEGARLGVPPEIIEPTWRAMIEAFVAYEHREFDAQAAARALTAQLGVGSAATG